MARILIYRHDRFLEEIFLLKHTKKGSCMWCYANATDRMRSSLKVGSNDSTNAPELASTLCNTSLCELAGECISKIAIGQIVVKRHKSVTRISLPQLLFSGNWFEISAKLISELISWYYIAN